MVSPSRFAADIRIAATNACMNCAFIKLGVGGCDIGSSHFPPRLVGVSVHPNFILTGRFIHAARALAVGLVSEVVEEADLGKAGQARMSTTHVADRAIGAAPVEGMPEHERRRRLDRAGRRDGGSQPDLFVKSADFREGLTAFIEKRRPNWAPVESNNAGGSRREEKSLREVVE